MKKVLIFMFTIVLITGCSRSDSTDNLEISQIDTTQMLEYLDTHTDNITSPSEGKVYSAYKILGLGKNKIYIWLVKEEYVILNDEVKSIGNIVNCPVVLYVNNKNGFLIKGHAAPEDGTNYGKTLRKLFPEDIRNIIADEIDYHDSDYLREEINTRVKEILNSESPL